MCGIFGIGKKFSLTISIIFIKILRHMLKLVKKGSDTLAYFKTENEVILYKANEKP